MQKIRTICRDCIFATYEGKTQVGCSLGQIEKLVKIGGTLVEAYDQTNQEFYIIEDKLCMWSRPRSWARNKKEKDYVSIIRKEMQIPYQIMIIANNSLDDVEKTIKSAVNQTIPPKHISVIRHADNELNRFDVVRILRKYCEPKNIIWRSQNVIDDPDLVVDDIISFAPYPYYAKFNAGFKIPKNTFEELDRMIGEDLFRFAVILPNKDGNGEIVCTSIHGLYAGNAGQPLIEKIRESQCQNMIYPINSLLSFFPK